MVINILQFFFLKKKDPRMEAINFESSQLETGDENEAEGEDVHCGRAALIGEVKARRKNER